MANDLRSDVEAFLAKTGLAPTRFGELALNDRHFVRQLRENREPRRSTEAKARQFMAEYRPPDALIAARAQGEAA